MIVHPPPALATRWPDMQTTWSGPDGSDRTHPCNARLGVDKCQLLSCALSSLVSQAVGVISTPLASVADQGV